MNGLERVIEENDMLLFLSPTGGIRALGINDFSFNEAEKGFRKDDEAEEYDKSNEAIQKTANKAQIYQDSKPVYVLLPEDMVQLQKNDYFWGEDALWLRYGGILHRKIVENRLQKYLDKEVYNE